MFISNKEKDWMMASIQILQKQVQELADKAEQAMKKPDAPWGLKADGTPRKKPGRPFKKESKECTTPT